MPKVALTDRFVQAAKPSGAPQTDYFDEKTPGLALRVSAGKKAWTFVFTAPIDGKRSRMTIGSYPATSLAEARTTALEARGYLERGIDPRVAMADAAAAAATVSGLIESYLAKHVQSRLRSADAVARRLRFNVLPVIGDMKIEDVTRRDVTRVIDAIVKRGSPIEANRVFAHFRAALRWAVGRGELSRSPMEGMRAPSAATVRDRVLDDAEIKHLWTSLPSVFARSKDVQRIIKLLLLTGQRAGEVSGMQVRELDLDAREWTLPGSRTKNGRKHVVPLSDQAIAIIREALAEAGAKPTHVFPSGNAGLPSAAISRSLGRALAPTKDLPRGRLNMDDWTAHDLRRTALTGLGRIGTAPIVLGHIVNHVSTTQAGVTLAVYARHTYDREKREALDAWGARVADIVAG